MSAPVLRRVVLGAVILILAAVGWRLRSESAEAGRRRDLAAEIQGEMAARPVPPVAQGPDVPEEEDAAVLYGEAFAAIAPGPLDNPGVWEALRDRPSTLFGRGGDVPPAVTAALDANERALNLLDRAAAFPRCRFQADPAFYGRALYACTLLQIRGWKQTLEGDGPGVVASVVRIRRLSRDLSGAPTDWRHSLVFTAETRAVGMLASLAGSPRLDEATAVAALAAAEGPWGLDSAWGAMARLQVREFDRTCLALLGPDAATYMKAHGIPVSSGIDRVLDVLPFGSGRTTPRERPTAAEVREARSVMAEIEKAALVGDAAVLAPESPLSRRFATIGPDGWAPAHFGGLHPSSVVWNFAKVAGVDLARTALALRIREFRTGDPPARLEGDGKGLRYDRGSDGWMLTVDLPTGTWPHPYGPVTFPGEAIEWRRPAR